MGPLNGLKIIEVAGIGPGPFAAMMLADMGADSSAWTGPATPGGDPDARPRLLNRGRRSIALDLKSPEGVACCWIWSSTPTP